MANLSGLTGNKNFQNAPVKDTAINTPGGGPGGLLNVTKDQKQKSTEAEFGDVLKNMQSQYGAKAEKPRTIKKQMDKDDFLKIMVTQMKNQDPLSPMKADQFATQLAQFTSVEQLQNLNQKMGQMTKANQPLERLAMTSLIGKVVTVDRDRFLHTDNEQSPLNYELPTRAKEAKLTVMNEAGEKISTRDLGMVKQGKSTYQWDGKKDDGMPAPSGNYLFRIEARDDTGKNIPIQSKIQAPVVGVSFESGEGVLLVGDVKNPTKTSMKNITRIDTTMRDMENRPAAGTAGGAPAAPVDALSANGVPPELQEKIRQSLGANFAAGEAGPAGGGITAPLNSDSLGAGASAAVREQLQNAEAAAAESSARGAALGKSGSPADPSEKSTKKLPAGGAESYLNNIEKTGAEGFPNGLSSGDNQ